VVLVEPGTETPLPIQLVANGPIPKESFIRIRGLPTSAKLSEGHAVAPGAWAITLSALPRLKISAPASGETMTQIIVTLVSIEGTIWAQATARFAVITASALPLREESAPNPSQATIATLTPAPAAPSSATDAPAMTNGRVQPSAGASPTAPPQMDPANRDRAENLMVKGEELLRDGDVAGARLFFRRAADLGLSKAAVALAETYDPNEFNRLGVQGMQPDIAAARRWYERARQLGASEAPERLRRLGSR
jgi:hypothetical protein